jgi:hypothetical protein
MKKRLIVLVRCIKTVNQVQQGCAVKTGLVIFYFQWMSSTAVTNSSRVDANRQTLALIDRDGP